MHPLLLLFSALAIASTSLWQSFLDTAGSRVRFGVTLDGRDPFRFHESDSFAPASTAKLFTAGAALATLGSDYRYPTVIRWRETAPGTAADLEIVGSGDPSWALAEFHEGLRDRVDAAATQLRASGVTRILGEPRAVAADPRWNTVVVPEGWKDGDRVSCEGALAQAFNINLNCAALVVSSSTRVAWRAEGLHFPVTMSVRAGRSTSLDVRLTHNANGEWAYDVIGTFEDGGGDSTLVLPIFDTRPWAQALFRDALVAKGIEIVAPENVKPLPADEFKQIVLYSRPLPELLKPFLKNSINFMGDAFLKAVGATTPGNSGSLLAPGLDRIYAFVRSEAGDARDLILHDGSGLSRTNRVTPELMMRYLSRLKDEKYFLALYDALPIAGVDGTLRNRMKGSAAGGILHAKTGTLSGVYNLAGYVPNGHDYVPFVILTATTAGNNEIARATEDRIGVHLAEENRGSAALETARLDVARPFPYFGEHAGEDNQ